MPKVTRSSCTACLKVTTKQLKKLAAGFEDDFHAPANIHIYATPAGKYGFSWHYDAEEVFIMQTSGRKEYSLRKNTVHPWPLVETIPQDMGYSREIMPLMHVLLSCRRLALHPLRLLAQGRSPGVGRNRTFRWR